MLMMPLVTLRQRHADADCLDALALLLACHVFFFSLPRSAQRARCHEITPACFCYVYYVADAVYSAP